MSLPASNAVSLYWLEFKISASFVINAFTLGNQQTIRDIHPALVRCWAINRTNLDQIQHGQIEAIIEFNMRHSWKTMLDNCTIIIKIQFQVGICTDKFQLDQIKNGRPLAINMIKGWLNVLENKMYNFRDRRMCPEKNSCVSSLGWSSVNGLNVSATHQTQDIDPMLG